MNLKNKTKAQIIDDFDALVVELTAAKKKLAVKTKKIEDLKIKLNDIKLDKIDAEEPDVRQENSLHALPEAELVTKMTEQIQQLSKDLHHEKKKRKKLKAKLNK